MKSLTVLAVVALAAFAAPAYAQFSNPLGSLSAPSVPSVSAPSVPSISSLTSLPSLGSASESNVAGLLEYCVKNNVLSGSDASTAQSDSSALLSQSNTSTSDPGYTSGSSGVLNTGSQAYSLAGGGTSGIEQQVCNEALSHAKSML